MVVLEDSYHMVTLDKQRHLVVEKHPPFVDGIVDAIANAAAFPVARRRNLNLNRARGGSDRMPPPPRNSSRLGCGRHARRERSLAGRDPCRNSDCPNRSRGDGMSADAHTAGGNFWQQSKEPRTVHPPVAGDLSVNVAIIGGGYTGLATAYHLKTADPSLDVAVLDAETAGFGAQWAQRRLRHDAVRRVLRTHEVAARKGQAACST